MTIEPDSAAAEVPRDQQAPSDGSEQDQPKADGAAAQDAAQAQDAARYRWLRTDGRVGPPIISADYACTTGYTPRQLDAECDAAIDAAMKEGR